MDLEIHRLRMEAALRDAVSSTIVLIILLVACPTVASTTWYQSYALAPFGIFLMIIGTGLVAASVLDIYIGYFKAKRKWESVRGRPGSA